MISFRRIALALLAALAMVGVVAASPVHTSAGARSCPGGVDNPYNIVYQNGVGAPFVWLATSAEFTAASTYTSGRRFYWISLGCTPQNWPYGYWENYKHQVLSASNNCTQWEIKNSTSDNGTVTINRDGINKDGSVYDLLASRYCNPAWRAGAVNLIWASRDIPASPLVPFSLNHPKSGYYLKVKFSADAP